jgi:gelsolin
MVTELARCLQGGATQYREEEGLESQAFLNYFKDVPNYLDKSSTNETLKKVNSPEIETRLIKIELPEKRGGRFIAKRVILSKEELNKNDVFILETSSALYIWIGSKSSLAQQVKAHDVANLIKHQERRGKVDIIVVEEGKEDNAFLSAFPQKSR